MMGSLLLACSGASGPAGANGGEPTGCTAEALEQCGSQRVEGIDVFDGQGTVDWASVARSGVTFAWIKATQGTYDAQATFAENWAGARRAGVLRGAYHFFDPTEDGAAQARRFLALVGPLAPGDLPPMLDLECPDGDADCLGTGASGSAPAADIAVRIWDWIDAVQAATGARPVVYTFTSYFASSGVDSAGLDVCPLFLAQPLTPPTSMPPPGDACVSVPAPWSMATMWQYSWTGSVPGIEGPVDRDAFLGSLAGLQALAAMPLADAGDAGSAGDAGVPGLPVAMASGAPSAGVSGAAPAAQAREAGAWPGSPGCF